MIGNDGLAAKDEQDFEHREGKHLFDIKVNMSGDEMGSRHGNSARCGLSSVSIATEDCYAGRAKASTIGKFG